MKQLVIGLLLITVSLVPCRGEELLRMTPETLWQLGQLGGAALSADAKLVAYSVRNYDLAENAGSSSLYVHDLTTGQQRKLLRNWKSIADVQFAPSAFGERIFISGKQGTDSNAKPQAWSVNPQDGGILQVTDLPEGIANLKVAPTGGRLAFTYEVKLDPTVQELYEDLPKADARVIDALMFRHWDQWHDFKYTHLHVADINDEGVAEKAVDFMEGQKFDCPLPPFGGSEQFAWSPDGMKIAYTVKPVDAPAQSTNSDVFLAQLDETLRDFKPNAKNITDGMPGYDNDPVFSPDGKFMAFHSMERAGFEADRLRVMIYDLESDKIHEATKELDQMAHAAQWTPDSERLVFGSEHQGTVQIFNVPRDGGAAQQISKGRFEWKLFGMTPDGKQALVSFTNTERPAELALLSLENGSSRTLTSINDEIFKSLELPTVEERWFEATDGKKIHSWVIYPPNFDPDKKWPMILYCQGGPQGQVGQWFSTRWNFHLMAANGYVVVAPNRRGLPGFGQEWNDQISRDWGGQAMQDLLVVTDVMRRQRYIDAQKVAAVGASFGGYTVYWLMGNHLDRFVCMIAHCGVFNLESMYGSTEELFFPDWDLGGPYWKDALRDDYDRFSPHRFVSSWKTPLLVIHGEKDFRVPVTQGMEAFTAAQVQNVPSRFLYFPEEGHWVNNPQNSVLWQRIFFDWLGRYCGTETTSR